MSFFLSLELLFGGGGIKVNLIIINFIAKNLRIYKNVIKICFSFLSGNLSPLYLNSRLSDTLPQPRMMHDFTPYGLRPYDFARQLLTSQTAVNKILGEIIIPKSVSYLLQRIWTSLSWRAIKLCILSVYSDFSVLTWQISKTDLNCQKLSRNGRNPKKKELLKSLSIVVRSTRKTAVEMPNSSLFCRRVLTSYI